ncbi:MAG: ATP-dependent DNA helicase RecG, partial [Oscillospiraceae bacterium]|nr:ATP-dependent DNA helicase RecG [Oscillospiraceae bacterium]
MQLGLVKGIGESREKLFLKLGISSIDLLLCHYPRRYIDMSDCRSVTDVTAVDSAIYRLTVLKKEPTKALYGGRTLTRIEAIDEDSVSDDKNPANNNNLVNILYFNNIYTPLELRVDEKYLFYGKINRTFISNDMNNPWIVKPQDINKLTPVYPTTVGLSSNLIANTVSNALKGYIHFIEETLPSTLMDNYRLISRRQAIEQIHQPKTHEDISEARKRLIFEELLVLLLGMMRFKERNRQTTNLHITDDISQKFIASLDFRLTDAQTRSVNEILLDLKQSIPMSRLLQGDVGSGKTVVAAVAAAVIVASGYQVAIMVPTEILALQHY